MIQSEEFLGRIFGPLLKPWLSVIKKLIKPIPKSVLISLVLTAAASAGNIKMHKKVLGSGNNTTTLEYLMMKWKTLWK